MLNLLTKSNIKIVNLVRCIQMMIMKWKEGLGKTVVDLINTW